MFCITDVILFHENMEFLMSKGDGDTLHDLGFDTGDFSILLLSLSLSLSLLG